MSKVGRKAMSKQRDMQHNEYEQQRALRIQENNTKLQNLGIKRISASFTSLVERKKGKTRQVNQKTNVDDEDYVPALSHGEEEEDDDDDEYGASSKMIKKHCSRKDRHQKNQFIPPMSMAKFFAMSQKQQREMVGDEALKSLSAAFDVVRQAMSSQQEIDDKDEHSESNADMPDLESDQEHGNEDIGDVRFDRDMPDLESDQEHGNEDIGDVRFDRECEMGKCAKSIFSNNREVRNEVLEDRQLLEFDNEMENRALLDVEEQSITSGNAKNKRGVVYCRKLTTLPPGVKLEVEFDKDGNPVGENSSIFAFFLGEQVRNRAVCPVQVKHWDEIKIEKIDHLWSCVQEKFSFDDPNLRKDNVLKRARAIFRDSRHKLKEKYFDKKGLETKDARLKNKPPDMLKGDWKYWVEYWSSPSFQEKSAKAKKSKSFQKMPHYTGTKSYARLKQEFKEKHGRECTRVDLLVESRKRKSKKPVDAIKLANNMHIVSEMEKLQKQRADRLIDKTDEEIFQDVLGKDTHGYLRAYGRGRSITEYFGVKPSRLDLAKEVGEIKKKSNESIEEAKKDAEEARKDAEEAKKEAENAKKEAEAIRNEVDVKIEANNRMWEEKMMTILRQFGIAPNASRSNGSKRFQVYAGVHESEEDESEEDADR